MKIDILFLTIINLVNAFWNAGLERKFFGGGHNHKGENFSDFSCDTACTLGV